MTQATEGAFRALADPTRRAIVAMLAERDLSVGAVAANFAMTRPAVKKHLRVLEDGRLITVIPRGRERINRLNPDGLDAVTGWLAEIDRFWSARLARLKTEVEKETRNGR